MITVHFVWKNKTENKENNHKQTLRWRQHKPAAEIRLREEKRGWRGGKGLQKDDYVHRYVQDNRARTFRTVTGRYRQPRWHQINRKQNVLSCGSGRQVDANKLTRQRTSDVCLIPEGNKKFKTLVPRECSKQLLRSNMYTNESVRIVFSLQSRNSVDRSWLDIEVCFFIWQNCPTTVCFQSQKNVPRGLNMTSLGA